MAKDKDKDKGKEAEDKEKPEGAEGEGEAQPKKSKKKIIIIAVAVVVLLAGTGAGLYFGGIIGPKGEEEQHEAEDSKDKKGSDKHAEKGKDKGKEKESKDEHGKKDKKEDSEKEESDEHGKPPNPLEGKGMHEGPDGVVYFDLPSFLVNLNSADTKRTTFLKMTVALEIANGDDAARLDLLKPRLIDTFNTYLRELRPADLNGSAGLQRLREELMVRVNETVHPAKVNDILFKEVIVQ